MGSIGPPELLLFLAILLLIFGATKLPKLARSMGQAGKELREGLKEGATAETVGSLCPFCSTEVPASSNFCPGCSTSAAKITEERKRLASSGN